MSNYYEILGIVKESSLAEIETAIDRQYNQWRQLVSHHDPKVVNEANQALQILEEIRSTLLEKDNRKKYDKTLASSEKIGGLGDPEVMLKEMMAGGKRSSSQTLMKNEERIDAWVCDDCGQANPLGTQFCQECGKKIAMLCPSCRTLSPLAKEFCPECGVNKKEFFDEQKNRSIIKINEEIAHLSSEIKEFESGNYPEEIKKNVKGKKILLIVSIIITIIGFFELNTGESFSLICLASSTIILWAVFINHSHGLRNKITQGLEYMKNELLRLESEKKLIISSEYLEE